MKKSIYLLSTTFLAILLFMNVNLMGQTPPFYVHLIQPDHNGLQWVVGETYTISWEDNLTQPVEIRLWNPNHSGGAAYEQLVPSVTGTTWEWEMDDSYTASIGYYIQVRSTVSPDIYHDEGKPFELIYAPANSIKVLQPTVSGISWAWNTTHRISWTDNLTENVDIYLVKGAGVGVKISPAGGISGTTWEWPIEEPAIGSDYKIRVQSTDHETVSAISSKNFAITKTTGTFKQIYQPNSTSIVWSKSSTHLISWRDEINEPVDIFVYDVSIPGNQYQIANDVEGSTFLWDLEDNHGVGGIDWVHGNHYMIVLKSSVDPLVKIESKYFTITNTVGNISKIYQPLTNTSWTVGTRHLISWLDNLEEPVDVYYKNYNVTTSSWGNWQLIEDDVEGTTCYWDIPSNLNTGQNYAMIMVVSTEDATVYKESYAFDLTLSSGTDIDVIQPSVSGISWAINTEHLISWEDDFPENVKIELVRYDNATTISNQETYPPKTIIASTEGSTYIWEVNAASSYGAHLYNKIRITSVDDATLTDMSNKTFAITASTGTFVNIIQPNGGEDWMDQMEYLVSWDENCDENFKIDLIAYLASDVNTTIEYSIVDNSPGVPGSTWTWDINQPDDHLSPTYKFKMRITSILDDNLTDISSNYFYIWPFGKSPNTITGLGGVNASEVVIYPNPTSAQFTITAPGTINQVEVRNMLGQVLYSNNVEAATQTNVDISGYNAGIYIVNVTVDGQSVTKKLFIQ
ncbi:MAG: T9SS type A sorting domain-containing protein [Bacteroidales bacterium]|jgi:hypothetical protein